MATCVLTLFTFVSGCSTFRKSPSPLGLREPLVVRNSDRGLFLYQRDQRPEHTRFADFRLIVDKKVYRMADTTTLRSRVSYCPEEVRPTYSKMTFETDRREIQETLAFLRNDGIVDLLEGGPENVLLGLKCEKEESK